MNLFDYLSVNEIKSIELLLLTLAYVKAGSNTQKQTYKRK